MKVDVLFFANFKEQLGCSQLEIELEEGSSISLLCEHLSTRGKQWNNLFADANKTVKTSINQEMASLSSVLSDGDEVAFFPPVTGG